MTRSEIILWHEALVTREGRQRLRWHQSLVNRLTYFSDAGNDTLAKGLAHRLREVGCRTFTLESDNVRTDLCSDPDCSGQEHTEDVWRISDVYSRHLLEICENREHRGRLVNAGEPPVAGIMALVPGYQCAPGQLLLQ